MKKFLAIILATLMLVAMLPAGIVSAEDEVTVIYYNFFRTGTVDTATGVALSADIYVSEEHTFYTGVITNETKPYLRGTWKTLPNGGSLSSVDSFGKLRGSYIQNQVSISKLTAAGLDTTPSIDENKGSYPCGAVILEVPTAGTYYPYIQQSSGAVASNVELYLIKKTASNADKTAEQLLLNASIEDRIGVLHQGCSTTCPNNTGATVQSHSGYLASVDLDAGEYYLLWAPQSFCNEITAGTNWFYLQQLRLYIDPTSGNNTANAAKNTDLNVSAGSADVVANDAKEVSATVNALARDVFGNEVVVDDDSIIEVISGVAAGSEQTVTAPDVDGYKFAYWSKGLGTKNRPVSEEKGYSFKATSGATYLYAIYEPKDAADQTIVEFYDINGEIVSRQPYDADSTINAPALPEATGRGAATAWVSANGKYDDLAAGASFTVPSDRNIVTFIAQYDEEAIDTVTVTAAGPTGITGAGTVNFGSTVTLTAPERNGTTVFAYWTKGGEVVSFDKAYSFVATADVTVTANYQLYKPTAKTSDIKKILFNTLGTGEIVAEFIGCDSAIERGFIFGGDTLGTATNKATMKTNAKTFSMINDLGVSAKAYAIFADGVVYSK